MERLQSSYDQKNTIKSVLGSAARWAVFFSALIAGTLEKASAQEPPEPEIVLSVEEKNERQWRIHEIMKRLSEDKKIPGVQTIKHFPVEDPYKILILFEQLHSDTELPEGMEAYIESCQKELYEFGVFIMDDTILNVQKMRVEGSEIEDPEMWTSWAKQGIRERLQLSLDNRNPFHTTSEEDYNRMMLDRAEHEKTEYGFSNMALYGAPNILHIIKGLAIEPTERSETIRKIEAAEEIELWGKEHNTLVFPYRENEWVNFLGSLDDESIVANLGGYHNLEDDIKNYNEENPRRKIYFIKLTPASVHEWRKVLAEQERQKRRNDDYRRKQLRGRTPVGF